MLKTTSISRNNTQQELEVMKAPKKGIETTKLLPEGNEDEEVIKEETNLKKNVTKLHRKYIVIALI